MAKRAAGPPVSPGRGLKNHSREHPDDDESESSSNAIYDPNMGGFEDNYEDEFESEDEVFEAGADGGREDSDTEGEYEENEVGGDTRMDVDGEESRGKKKGSKEVYLPSRRTLGKDEVLEPDTTAYHMLHRMNITWPCLSFDILRDWLGEERRSYPATTYLVTGTQADQARKNEIMVLKLSGLGRMQKGQSGVKSSALPIAPDFLETNKYLNIDDEDDDADTDDSDTEDDPILESRAIPVTSTTNRIRTAPHTYQSSEHLVASMHESGDVLIHDVHQHVISFDTPGTTITANRPLATLKMHGRTEGYAIDWSPLSPRGQLLTGDNSGKIYHTSRTDGGGWKTDGKPFTGHSGSVEEIQWSPVQPTVFASGSSDGTVKIWDLRDKKHRPQLSIDVSSSDVNVMSWCRRVDWLLATGADDGVWSVWDVRTFPNSVNTPVTPPIVQFAFHQQPITSVEFHPSEDSVVAVASADNTVTLWDLSVEVDDEESRDTGGMEDVPPQLLFVHYMKDVKEMHWHPQIPGAVVATGGEGFNVFKTISVE